MSETRVVHVMDQVPDAIYIGRHVPRKGIKGSLLANPFKISGSQSRQQVINMYRNSIFLFALNVLQPPEEKQELAEAIIELRGKPLACWCRHDGEPKTVKNACHGDVLIEILDSFTDDELRAMI